MLEQVFPPLKAAASRSRLRALWLAAGGFALLALAFLAAHLGEVRTISDLALRVRGGQALDEAQVFERFTNYASHGDSSQTRLVIAMLLTSGIHARPLFVLNDRGRVEYTVVQARIDGRWVVRDPRARGVRHVALMNWRRIPIVLPAIEATLELILGPDSVARIARPEIWMWPREMLAVVFAGLAVVCVVQALRPRG
jgi:hypothetical protein